MMKARTFFMTVFVFICVSGISIKYVFELCRKSFSLTQVTDEEANVYSRGYESDTEQTTRVYQQRWESYKHVCSTTKERKTTSEELSLFYAGKYRLAANIVPKVGSTTLIAIFYMLTERNDEDVFMQSRMKMHVPSKNKNFRKVFKVDKIKDVVVLMPTRNPYSRLYSAYIDKVYLADDVKLTQSVIKHARIRGDRSQWWNFNVTFQNFLDYALDGSISKHVNVAHYEKIFDSKFCLLNTTVIIIKQESFSTDIKHALETVNVKDKDLEVIGDVLTSSRAETTVSAIVQTELQKLKDRFKMNKVFQKVKRQNDAMHFVIKRLWTSFQNQGLISSRSKIPTKKFSPLNSVNKIDEVLEVFLSEIQSHPLTSEERNEQRQRAMLEAYKHVDPKSIKKIQVKYDQDFQAFEYDPVLPLEDKV